MMADLQMRSSTARRDLLPSTFSSAIDIIIVFIDFYDLNTPAKVRNKATFGMKIMALIRLLSKILIF